MKNRVGRSNDSQTCDGVLKKGWPPTQDQSLWQCTRNRKAETRPAGNDPAKDELENKK